MSAATFKVRIAREIAEVDAVQWDACANPAPAVEETSGGERYNPFISHAFLLALEQSRSVGGRSGWAPMHVLIEDKAGRLVAAAPTYAKSHSQGEYVFDHGWAQAYARAGGRYYPKLQVAVPFTPATGRRLLVAPNAPPEARATLIAGLRGLCKAINASSIHVTFANSDDRAPLEEAGFSLRTGEQFHFANPGYFDFEAFLAELSSRKRKNIKRERKDALADGVSIEWVTGAALQREHWDAFFAFYMDTGSRKWGSPYLTRKFFDLVGASMAERILLVMARREGRYIAGAINFIGDDALYGRNWGAIEEHPFLHFEVCYYQAIDFAIRHKLKRVEAGAQGEHKLARGYRPVPTFSLHDFADKGLGEAVAEYLARERVAVEETIALYEEHVPFRRA
jgi:predicted N-acyltransferase